MIFPHGMTARPSTSAAGCLGLLLVRGTAAFLTTSEICAADLSSNPSPKRNESNPLIEKCRISEVMLSNDAIFQRIACGAWVTGSGPSSAVLAQELWELRPEANITQSSLLWPKCCRFIKVRIQGSFLFGLLYFYSRLLGSNTSDR